MKFNIGDLILRENKKYKFYRVGIVIKKTKYAYGVFFLIRKTTSVRKNKIMTYDNKLLESSYEQV